MFEIIRSDRRTMALEIRPDGALLVRAPKVIGESVIHNFIRSHDAWIEKTRRLMGRRMALKRLARFEEGENFLYLGKEYPLHIAEDMHGKLLFENRFILSARHQAKARRLFERWYRQAAFFVFTERCRIYARRAGVSYKSLSLSSAKRRWGCCTSKQTLRFNWRLVMAPLEIIDYVVAHELTHLKEPNHSKRFWTAVSEIFPGYEAAKKWLKENALTLQF